MNFTLFFSLISTLSFVVEFPVHSGNKQDYFYFEGRNQSAYLSRNDQNLSLFLSQGSNYSLYRKQINRSNFFFSWNGFQVNDVGMTVVKTIGSVDDFNFDHFTFISPIVDVIFNEPETECVYSLSDNVNYWYILLIVLVVSALFESKSQGLGIVKKLGVLIRSKTASEPLAEISEIEEELPL